MQRSIRFHINDTQKKHFINGPLFFDIIGSDIINTLLCNVEWYQKKRVRNRSRNDARVFQFLLVQKKLRSPMHWCSGSTYCTETHKMNPFHCVLACVYVLCRFSHSLICTFGCIFVIVSQTINTFTLTTTTSTFIYKAGIYLFLFLHFGQHTNSLFVLRMLWTACNTVQMISMPCVLSRMHLRW